MRRLTVGLAAAALVLSACSAKTSGTASSTVASSGASSASSSAAASAGASPSVTASAPAPGTNVYAAAGAGALSDAVAKDKPMVYVPDQVAGWVEEIDPTTYTVVKRFRVATSPEHVVPSWDLKTLWVNSDLGDTLTPIDPLTGAEGTPIHVADPYNLYFVPDGSGAIVMAERLRRIDLHDPHTMALKHSLPIPCYGVNHADFTADLTTFVASCEFSGQLLVIDAHVTKVLKVISLNGVATPGATSPKEARAMAGPKKALRPGASSMVQDVRLTPDGRYFLVADMIRNGVWKIDATTFTIAGFVHTGLGAHGIYPSRDGKKIYVSNRDDGTVSVLDATTLAQVALWRLPGKASPDMGGVTADGKQLWLSGRYSSCVYVIDTATGRTLHVIRTKASPHGLAVWPQPGRFSLGHTGNTR